MKKIPIAIILFYSVTLLQAQSTTNGLIGYWPFNGNANDVSGNQINGIVNGATLTSDRFNEVNRAFYFDGNSFINLGDIDELNSVEHFTISIWVSPDNIHQDGGLFSKGTNGTIRLIATLWGDGKVYFEPHSTADRGFITSNQISPVGQWSHIVMVFDGLKTDNQDKLKVYVNGQEISDVFFQGSIKTSTASLNGMDFELGRFVNNNDSKNYKGKLDELSIYNRALSSEEVELLHENGIPDIFLPSAICDNIYCDGENLGIGTPDARGYKLAVAGQVISEGVKIQLIEDWPDFVFKENYNFKSIEEVDKYISERGHLPEIPSKAEVTENGIDLGEMNAKLLQKIEELTLYMININKRVNELETENQELKEKINSLENK